MSLKTSISVNDAPQAPQTVINYLSPYSYAEVELALAYAANAALTESQEGTHDYLPKTPEEAKDFHPHLWVIAAICAAMRGVRQGSRPVLGEPFASFIPSDPVPYEIALVAEGRDLGLLTESRMTGDVTATVYARAAIKVLDKAVAEAYAISTQGLSGVVRGTPELKGQQS